MVSSTFVKTIRLSQSAIDSLCEQLVIKSIEAAPAQDGKRRYPYRNSQCVIHMQMPGMSETTPYMVPTLTISEDCLSFVHGSFVHIGTRCLVQLVDLQGAWDNIEGAVTESVLVKKMIHEVVLEFSEPLNLGHYCRQAIRVRILLVDDDPSITRVTAMLLKKLDVEVDIVDNGPTAIGMALEQTYSAIMMDVEMPGMDGLEATKELRKRGYKGLIIAATGRTQDMDRQACIDAGCDRYVPKPLTPLSLDRIVNSLRQDQ